MVPIYEYQCQACDHRLEALQRLSEPPLTTCPECSGELRKLMSAPAFQFKGSGWYVTDYARKGGEAKGKQGAAADKAEAGADKGAKADHAGKAGDGKAGDGKAGGGEGKAKQESTPKAAGAA